MFFQLGQKAGNICLIIPTASSRTVLHITRVYLNIKATFTVKSPYCHSSCASLKDKPIMFFKALIWM